MKKRWLWIGLLLLLLGAAALVAFLEPTRIVPGYLAGEPFYRHRPIRYWREVLRECGQRGALTQDERKAFISFHESLPILLECARDPDPHVRWPAVALLGWSGLRTQRVLDALVAALDDEETAVRIEATLILGRWGPMARSAVPALVGLLKDPEDEVALYADLTLWDVDLPAAVEATGWKPFASQEWKFSAMMPGQPGRQERQLTTDEGGQVTIHSFTTTRGITHLVVGISEYSEEVATASNNDERLDAAGELEALGQGGKVVSTRPVEQQGRKGREHVIEVEQEGKLYVLRSRVFWSGQRFFQLKVVYSPKYENPKAVDYFFESFRLTEGTLDDQPRP